eukprot:1896825-Prorocentrum_lima.AAC.1
MFGLPTAALPLPNDTIVIGPPEISGTYPSTLPLCTMRAQSPWIEEHVEDDGQERECAPSVFAESEGGTALA